ncbi:MAG: hypothetical protein AB8G99_25410 [Planctomycetaceae bacterium]
MRRKRTKPNRAGLAAKEVVVAMAILLIFSAGLYFLAQDCFARLYHYTSSTVGGPYL